MADKPNQNADQAAKPAGKSKKLLIIIIATVVLLAGGGTAAWLLLMKGGDEETQAAAPKKKDPLFVPMEQFTVNLADDGGERFAQISLILEIDNGDTNTAVKAHMPVIRNAVLLLLSSKTSKDLLSVAGKEKLAIEVANLTGAQLGWAPAETAPDDGGERTRTAKPRARPNPIVAVHFAHFIVQ